MVSNILVGAQEGRDFNPKLKSKIYPKLKLIIISNILVGAQEGRDFSPNLKFQCISNILVGAQEGQDFNPKLKKINKDLQKFIGNSLNTGAIFVPYPCENRNLRFLRLHFSNMIFTSNYSEFSLRCNHPFLESTLCSMQGSTLSL